MLVRAVNTAISAGWLILAVMAVRAVCRKAPRSMICLLWAIVALRLICPFSLKSPLSLIPSAETIPEAAVTEAEKEAAEPVALDIVDNHIYWALPAPEVRLEAAQVRDWTLYGTVLWLTGTAALLIYALVSWLRLRRQVAASVRVKGNIYICDWIDSPFILGVLRPKIYLPSAMDREQFTYVLAHEHAHLKCRDHWWKPLGFLLLAVYWFQPLAWAAFILFCRDMELACDERVVRDMGMWEKKVYSQILLSCSATGPLASVCPVSFGGVGVKARIRSVLRYRKPAFRAVVGMGAVTVVLAVCFLTDPQEGMAVSTEAAATPSPTPTPVAHHLTGEDIAAMNSPQPQPPGEKEFAAMLAEEWTSDGYMALTYDEFASQYTESLVPLDNAPDGCKNIGCVFVRPDPFTTEYTMITQILYDYGTQTAILIQQSDIDSESTEPFFYYSDSDEMGEQLHGWFSYRAGYDGVVNGTSINMMLRSTQDLGAKNCWLIFRSLWPEG